MVLTFLKSKIHRATITDADLHYEGSISVSRELLEAADINPYEQVDIYNVTNGERFTTYAIEGREGQICLNGAAAWKGKAGDKIIIATYCLLEPAEVRGFKPRVVFVDEKNRRKV